MIIPKRAPWLSGVIFVFAMIVELSQIFPLADMLEIDGQLMRILMGTSFDVRDILAYFAGSLITACIDIIVFRPDR